MNNAVKGNGFAKKTETAGTKIKRLVPPLEGYVTRISKIVATAAGTAHTLTAMRPIGRTTLTAAAADGQAVINVASLTDHAIAANDFLAVEEDDGVVRHYVVSSVSSLAVTLTGNLTAGCNAFAKVWQFGIESDTEAKTGEAHQPFALPASATTTFSDTEGGVIATHGKDEPILLVDSNGTNAGSIDQVSYGYTRD